MRNNKTAWKYWNCKPTGKLKMTKVSELEFTPEMLENGWRGHRVEMPNTDAQRCVSDPESAARFIANFGDVEMVYDEKYNCWTVPAFAVGREEFSERKQAHCARWGCE